MFVLTICTNGWAQIGCGTEFVSPPDWFFEPEETTPPSGQPKPSSETVPQTYILRIFVHFVRNSRSETNVDITKALFYLIGHDFIHSDYFYSVFDSENDEKFREIVEINKRRDAMNIYVLGDSTKWEWGGMGMGRNGKLCFNPFSSRRRLL